MGGAVFSASLFFCGGFFSGWGFSAGFSGRVCACVYARVCACACARGRAWAWACVRACVRALIWLVGSPCLPLVRHQNKTARKRLSSHEKCSQNRCLIPAPNDCHVWHYWCVLDCDPKGRGFHFRLVGCCSYSCFGFGYSVQSEQITKRRASV